VAAATELAQQQRGDQVAADDEEDVDPKEAAGHPLDLCVVEEDSQHGDRPEGVDSREIRKAAVLRPADGMHNGERCRPGPSSDHVLQDPVQT
jgi:hypothetical protein